MKNKANNQITIEELQTADSSIKRNNKTRKRSRCTALLQGTLPYFNIRKSSWLSNKSYRSESDVGEYQELSASNHRGLYFFLLGFNCFPLLP